MPAGTVTRYSVALGRRSINSESYSKVSVLVPNQRQIPGRAGSIFRGMSFSARSLNVPSGTIGWLNVTLINGAIGISPSGANRNTWRGPAATTPGVGSVSKGGNVSLIVLPGRGGGRTSCGRLNAVCSPGTGDRVGRCARIDSISAGESGTPVACGEISTVCGWDCPSLNLIFMPYLSSGLPESPPAVCGRFESMTTGMIFASPGTTFSDRSFFEIKIPPTITSNTIPTITTERYLLNTCFSVMEEPSVYIHDVPSVRRFPWQKILQK